MLSILFILSSKPHGFWYSATPRPHDQILSSSACSKLFLPLLGLTVILFVLLRIGGDPVAHLVDPEASVEEVAKVRAILWL